MTAIRIIDDHLELANIGTNSHAQIDTHIAAADDYIKRDGSLALTSDWDIGDTRKILTDEVRARDGAGLKLYDDGGNGIFVEDGGQVGIGTVSPDKKLTIRQNADDDGLKIYGFDDKSADYITLAIDVNGDGVFGGSGGRSFKMSRTLIYASNVVQRFGSTFSNSYAIGHKSSNDTWQLVRQQTLGSQVIIGIKNDGSVGINTDTPTAKLDINSDILRLRTAKTPTSAGDTGNTGDLCGDANYIYRCVSTNSWKRAALNVW